MPRRTLELRFALDTIDHIKQLSGRWPIGRLLAALREKNFPRSIKEKISARLVNIFPTVILLLVSAAPQLPVLL